MAAMLSWPHCVKAWMMDYIPHKQWVRLLVHAIISFIHASKRGTRGTAGLAPVIPLYRSSLSVWLAPINYLNQWWKIVNNQNSYIYIKKNEIGKFRLHNAGFNVFKMLPFLQTITLKNTKMIVTINPIDYITFKAHKWCPMCTLSCIVLISTKHANWNRNVSRK